MCGFALMNKTECVSIAWEVDCAKVYVATAHFFLYIVKSNCCPMPPYHCHNGAFNPCADGLLLKIYTAKHLSVLHLVLLVLSLCQYWNIVEAWWHRGGGEGGICSSNPASSNLKFLGYVTNGVHKMPSVFMMLNFSLGIKDDKNENKCHPYQIFFSALYINAFFSFQLTYINSLLC